MICFSVKSAKEITRSGWVLLPSFWIKSLAKILPWIAYPVESFGFACVKHDPPPPLPGGVRGGLGKEPGLFDQLDDGQANEFQCVHGSLPPFLLSSLASAPTPSTAAA